MSPATHTINKKTELPDQQCIKLCKSGFQHTTDWELDEALACFQEAVDRCPSFHIPYNGQAAVYWLLEDYNKVYQSIIKAFKHEPSRYPSGYYSNSLQTLLQIPINSTQCDTLINLIEKKRIRHVIPASQGLFKNKIDDIDDLTETDFIGRLLLSCGEFKKASECYDQLVGLCPRNFDDWLFLSTSYVLAGKVAEGWAIAKRSIPLIGHGAIFMSWGVPRFTRPLMNHIKSAIDQIAEFDKNASTLYFLGPSDLSVGSPHIL